MATKTPSLEILDRATQIKWNRHRKEWEGCQLCPLGERATKHVLCRGTLPCDILFIGEAPGEIEDTLGEPFVGPAGKILDSVLCEMSGRQRKDTGEIVSYAIGNILACIPRPSDPSKGAFRTPEKEEAKACHPRVAQLVGMAEPKGIVLLGKIAERFYLHKDSQIPILALHHPSYILRTGGARASNVNYTRAVLQLREFIRKVA